MTDTRWLDNLQKMPKYRGYTRDYLKETMIDIPRKEQAEKEAKEQDELCKLDESRA